jgi:cytochrome c551/c552
MTSSERSRRRRARLRAAHAQALAEGHKSEAQMRPQACAWCGRSGCTLVGENAVMICAPCIEEASVAVRTARAARKRAAVDVWDDDSDLLADSTSSP